ncbi:uncharacterized protein LOC103953116 [Pyrus x bretschneideri]|uniref:uncharacterized protein LOC103953116 n=1 Tax=Pyrus x bretschneideri TaxID=225117 RepID=UPI00202F91F8|nr:uncharacterized protein LOC103953116 [Pyrus x bretschneideri]
MASGEKEFEIELESGGSNGQKIKFLGGVFGWFLHLNESITCTCGIVSSSSLEKSGEVSNVSVETLIERNSEGEESQGHMPRAEKACENEQCKKKNSRNAPKPPRPPKRPSLDAADQKLVREITELAKRKRARIEQMKVAKKMKASKSSSFYSGISALIITLLFFFVVIFQGISSRSVPTVGTQGSPEPAVATTQGFVPVEYHKSDIRRSTNQNFGEDQISRSGGWGS